MSFKAFIDAAKSMINLGAATNAGARQEIREVVGKLADELDRALSLTDSYLVGAKYSIDNIELSRYLAEVDGKLMGSYREHHICAGLYQLADKFKQIFDPTRFSVDLANYSEIPKLINELMNGERVILDDLHEMANQLKHDSSQLYSGLTNREQVLTAVECHREEIERYRQQIKQQRRTLLSKL